MKLYCFTCKKPVTDEFPDNMIIFRGTAKCPECTAKEEEEGTKSEMVKAHNMLTAFVKDMYDTLNLSREQIRYLLTDRLNDMSKTDLFFPEAKHESS